MKTKIFAAVCFLFLLATMALGQKSKMSLSFTGVYNGIYAQLDSVRIQNLDRNCDTTLRWPETVFHKGNVGIDDRLTPAGGFQVFQNRPNPAGEKTSVGMYLQEAGDAEVRVSDFSGNEVASLYQKFSQGYHVFLFKPGSSRMYLFTVTRNSVSKTIKITSGTKHASSPCSLAYSGTGDGPANYKDAGLTGSFQFAWKDNLRLTGYHNHLPANITDAPDSSKSYSFTFTVFSCGSSILVNHVAGAVAPVTKTVNYGTVRDIPGEPLKCWITSNLGADHQAAAVDDAAEPSAGWYWQFNRKQGYKHDGATRTPNLFWNSAITENLYWETANDPCSLELGYGWRIPLYSEWFNVDNAGGWIDWNGPWNTPLKLHAAGTLLNSNGSLISRGSYGFYWSSTESGADAGNFLFFYSGRCFTDINYKSYGFPVRCIRE